MERPKLTKQLTIEECGGNQWLISCVHHGLVETSLRDFYPHLNFDEAVAFAAGSWRSRNEDIKLFRTFLDNADGIYDVFNGVYGESFRWLNRHKDISDKLRRKHEGLNPFGGRNFRKRIERVDDDCAKELIGRLEEETKKYVFECQYVGEKLARGGDNSGLSIMRFQQVYPRSGKIVPAFASEIARILSKYPREYKLLEEEVEESPAQFFDSLF